VYVTGCDFETYLVFRKDIPKSQATCAVKFMCKDVVDRLEQVTNGGESNVDTTNK